MNTSHTAFDLLQRVTRIGFVAATALLILGQIAATAAEPNSLKPPANGSIPVAFLISDGAVVIDFCGPWEVFQAATFPVHDEVFLFTPYLTRLLRSAPAAGCGLCP